MIEFKISKFLTKIDVGGTKVCLKTPIFNEITGIEDISQLQDVGSAKSPDRNVKQLIDDYLGDQSTYNVSINGTTCSIERILEACDLNQELFESMIRNASFVAVSPFSNIGIWEYLLYIKNIMSDLLYIEDLPEKITLSKHSSKNDENPPEPKKVSHGYIDWDNLKCCHASFMGDPDVYYRASRDIVSELYQNPERLNAFVRKINIIFAHLPFYHKDEELFLQPMTAQKINSIVERCIRYARSQKRGAGVPSLSIESLIDIILLEARRGLKQGVITLMDKAGCIQIYREKDIDTKLTRMILQKTGIYGKTKTLSWNLDATKEIY